MIERREKTNGRHRSFSHYTLQFFNDMSFLFPQKRMEMVWALIRCKIFSFLTAFTLFFRMQRNCEYMLENGRRMAANSKIIPGFVWNCSNCISFHRINENI